MEKKIALATLALLPLSTINADADQIGVVTATSLNVRSGPGQNYSKIFTLSKGEKVTIKSTSNGWYKIANSKNREGYASSQYIKISNDTTVYDKKIVTANLNMRSGPSTSYRIVKTLPKGSEVEVISTSNNWSKIRFNGSTGYVSNEYLSNINSDTNTNNNVNNDANISTTVTKYVNVSSLNVRSGPSTSYSILGSLKLNEQVEVIESMSSWSKINYKGKIAYVSTQYLSDQQLSNDNNVDSKPIESKIKYVNVSSLNVRSGPSTSYSKLGSLKLNERVEVIESMSSWSKINYKGKVGYVSTEYLSDNESFSDNSNNTQITETKNKKVNTSSLNVRSGPSTSYSKIGALTRGTVIKVLSESNGWSQIEFNNQIGYVSSEYLIDISETGSIETGNSTNNSTSSYINVNYTLDQHVDLQHSKALRGGNVINASLSTGLGSGYINATRDDLIKYMNPDKILMSSHGMNQFLRIDSYKGGVTAERLNTYLNSLSGGANNVFYGKGQAFIDAAQKYNIDLAYFVAHAMVETGYGTSTLAKGQYVNGVKVYNFFGISAFDGSAVSSGKNYAYKMGWTSVEKTLDGSAAWIASNYIKSSYNQNTLYKMRWSYEYSNHQYATDVNWANLISSVMTKITTMYSSISLQYEIPKHM